MRRYQNMPTISRFAGLKVLMYYNDHAPPHIHVDAGGDVQFVVNILNPSMPPKILSRDAKRSLVKWIENNEEELLANWHRAENGEELVKIPGP